jgi:hypothetical protein
VAEKGGGFATFAGTRMDGEVAPILLKNSASEICL